MDFQRSVLPTTLRWASLALCAAIVGLLFWALSPVDDIVIESVKPKPPKQVSIVSQEQDLRSAELTSLLSRPLQGKRAPTKSAVVARPKPTPQPVRPAKSFAPKPTSLGVRLVGTIIEPGANLAIASDRDGKLSFRSEGERFKLQPKGLLVESIDNDGIWVRYRGKRIQWTVGEDLRLANGATNAASKPAMANPAMANPGTTNSPMATPATATTLQTDDNMDNETPEFDPNDRTPIRSEEFPKMSLDDELDFLNG